MRLRTVESYWLLKNGLCYTYPSLKQNIKTEVVVVGGGITGALITASLLENGYKVIVLDKRDIAMGSTAATTAMIQYELDLPLVELQKKIGEESANLVYLESIKAVRELGRLIRKYKLSCEFKSKKSLYLAHDKKALEDLKQEFSARKSIGIRAEWLSEKQLKTNFGLKAPGGILSQVAASLDAYQMAHELFHLLTMKYPRALKIFDQTNIKKVESSAKGVQILIDHETGSKIDAKKIVYCSGFESTELIKEKVADLFETFVVISEEKVPMPKYLKNTLVWNTASPYIYFRTTGDGRVLIGGEDTSIRIGLLQEILKEQKSKSLMKKYSEINPDFSIVEDFTWAGTFGSTKDSLPYIGKCPDHPNNYFVLGFGGNGITFSVQGMKLIIALLEDETHPLLELYRFGR